MRIKLAKKLVFIILVFGFAILIVFNSLSEQLFHIYEARKSQIIKDRKGIEIAIFPNENGYWARYQDEFPQRIKELLIKKEDRFFNYHFGFNPKSMFLDFLGRFGIGNRKASSTITQQLVKVLLGKEFERSFKNIIIEFFYTLSLEIFKTKQEILTMYLNSVYFGNQAQGFEEAALLYFGLPSDLLDDSQIIQLLATLGSPTETNPGKPVNKEISGLVAKNLGLADKNLIFTDYVSVIENMKNYSHFSDSYFEIKSLFPNLAGTETLTIDKEISEKTRQILKRNVEKLETKNVNNGAIIIIKLPENEILSLIGTPDPNSSKSGYQINMLEKPRPIGSTVKPFIYLKAFEMGLRPYTLVDDREYKYITALGFPLYPKNFDYKYRGEVNLHYALSNSLNVPSVKVLEYIGLEVFYDFLEKDLEFTPVQPLNNYQLGIALGALEMNLYNLSNYFTIFPNQGTLKQLKIEKQDSTKKEISKKEYVQLINKILSDRKTGIEQFGMISELNLSQENYALKTGTSRDFHDSWVIGYTPDFLVGVWVGNADNTPTEAVSGQIGAGKIWSETMEMLFSLQYNKKTEFDFSLLKEYKIKENLEYGLPEDDFGEILYKLKEKDETLILNPHEQDVFLLEENTRIILNAKEKVKWYSSPPIKELHLSIAEEFLGEQETIIISPKISGQYKIKAVSQDKTTQEITIFIRE